MTAPAPRGLGRWASLPASADLGRESISKARGDRLLDGIACIGTFALVSARSLVAAAARCRLIPKSSSANKPAWEQAWHGLGVLIVLLVRN